MGALGGRRWLDSVALKNMGTRAVKFRGKLETIANPAAVPCASTRKPVQAITDRAKRYRANQAGCKPAGAKRCVFCGRRKNVEVHHIDGDESNGGRSNLGWACRPCNTAIGAAMKRAGLGKRTRQFNPKKRGKGSPDFKQYAWAVSRICRRADQARGLCSPSNDPEVLEAVSIVRATPAARRREYSALAAAARGRSFSEVPF